MKAEEWKGGPPGSEKAGQNGCKCPVLDNAHGRGRYGDGEKYGWWVVASCKLHAEQDKNQR